jgi:hypothetical protein
MDLVEPLERRTLLSAPAMMGPMPLFAAAPGDGANFAFFVDLDGDGRKDVVIGGLGEVVVRRSGPHGGFHSAQVTTVPASPAVFKDVFYYGGPGPYGGTYIGDFNGDGHTDFALSLVLEAKSGRFYHRLWLFSGDGHGNLTLTVIHSFDAIYDRFNFSGTVLDIDGDGRDEVLGTYGHAYAFVGDQLVDKGTYDPDLRSGQAIDLNGDGRKDIVYFHQAAGQPTSFILLKNTGAGYRARTLFQTPQADITVSGFAVSDLDLNGSKDIVYWGQEFPAGSAGLYDGTSELVVYAAPVVAGVYTPETTPLYAESLAHIRARSGQPASTPFGYEYVAQLEDVHVDASFLGDARPEIRFTISSVQTYAYRYSGPATGGFAGRFGEALVAGDPAGSDGVPTYTPLAWTATPDLFSPTSPGHGPGLIPPMASDDLDGDGLPDYIILRGDVGALDSNRLVYAQMSSLQRPIALALSATLNAVDQPSSFSVAMGDRVKMRLKVSQPGPTPTGGQARMYLDTNNDGILDAGDLQLRIGVLDTAASSGDVSVYSFNVVRTAPWGGPGVRAIFVVPYDALGNPGVPVTRMVNLV